MGRVFRRQACGTRRFTLGLVAKRVLAGCGIVLAAAACGGGDGLTAELLAKRFREATGVVLELQSAHGDEEHQEEADDEGEVFLEPAQLTPARARRYGRFTLVFWPGDNPLVNGVWNRDFRGWTYQTTYGEVALLWRAGRERLRDERWRRLDALVRSIADDR